MHGGGNTLTIRDRAQTSEYVDLTGTVVPPQEQPATYTLKYKNPFRYFSPVYLWQLPFLGLTYLIHARYRHFKPRRWPKMTPLRIGEIYLISGVVLVTEIEREILKRKMFKDRDWLTIEVMGRLYNQGARESLQRVRRMKGVDYGGLRADWSGYREDASLLAKFKWWSNHAWSDPVAWNLIWFDLCLPAHILAPDVTVSRRDWDILVTHFANYVQGVDGVPCTFAPDRLINACAIITPFAICARIMCPPVVYLPINIAQRIVIYTACAVYCIHRYQHYRYTATIKDKRKAARLLLKIVPHLEKNVDTVTEWGYRDWDIWP